MGFLDAAVAVLQEAGEPLHYDEITQRTLVNEHHPNANTDLVAVFAGGCGNLGLKVVSNGVREVGFASDT